MWLFVYEYYNECSGVCKKNFKIVSGFSFYYAIVNFYDTFAKKIDKELFGKMIGHLNIDDAIEVFNSITGCYKIIDVYSDLKEVYLT